MKPPGLWANIQPWSPRHQLGASPCWDKQVWEIPEGTEEEKRRNAGEPGLRLALSLGSWSLLPEQDTHAGALGDTGAHCPGCPKVLLTPSAAAAAATENLILRHPVCRIITEERF